MTKEVKYQLWRLIKSLTKAEKRNFKLYATRAGATGTSKFIQLFDVIDRMVDPDDALAMKRMKITTGQFSNLKRHLYQELLTSLRLIFIRKEIDIELREQIDFTRILYGKGHYLDALRTLERAKTKAVEHNQDLLHLEILEFQKLIEARHITLSRQVSNKMDLLLNESGERSHNVLNTSELFSLSIQIHGRYIEGGHSKDEDERLTTRKFWDSIQAHRVGRASAPNTFHQQVHRFQAGMWYHYIQLDISAALEAAINVQTLFTLSRQMIFKDPDLYLRSMYYVAMLAYLRQDERTVARNVQRLDEFLGDEKIHLNENSRSIGKIYSNLSTFNLYFLQRDKERAYEHGRKLISDYTEETFRPNNHRWGLFLYKIAAASFLVNRYDEALDHLNDIINTRSGVFRKDLLINTRILHAICNFELSNYSLVDYHLTSLSRLLRRSRETAEVHRLAVSAIRRLLNLPAAERAPIYADIRENLVALRELPFENKALAYLGLEEWLDLHL
ncbi:MAG: hypothetical protein ACI81P_002314 [Neolewinella sp.]|jgi:hypothetical protein